MSIHLLSTLSALRESLPEAAERKGDVATVVCGGGGDGSDGEVRLKWYVVKMEAETEKGEKGAKEG